GGSDLNDSGKLIGESIGMKVTEFDRTEYMRRGNFPEAEFFAYGSGLDANWLGLEDAVVGRMVFTGIHGDFLWERLGFPEIWNSLAHLTLTEFRLRTGYIHIAPCTIGMNHYNSIRMISSSQEMQPWSIGSFYDRPIPRRIGEEAGIDRLLFGQQKKVTAIDMRSGHRGMTAASASDFKKYIKLVGKPRSLLQKVLFAPNKLLFHINLLINSKITIMAKYFGKKIHLPTFMSEKYRISPRLSNLTFHWGHEKIRNRYK
ncbi:MAG: hypothetical protein HAW67_06740, partial [Endozoicomonadaceae bacterium]|nr:hypothetical protein [Endozoicomonadaceae bacterium]